MTHTFINTSQRTPMQEQSYPQPGNPAHFNPEEMEALRRQRERAGKWCALVLTIAIHAVAILVLTLIVLPVIEVAEARIHAKTSLENIVPPDPQPKSRTVRPKPSSGSSGAAFLRTPNPRATVFVPIASTDNRGSDLGVATSMGMGFDGQGPGDGQKGLEGLPPGIQGRCTKQERLKRLREGGGNDECESAVVRALLWLQANQNPDGSWGQQYKASMTGLALLAFLGHCETPRSEQYGQTVTKSITFLINTGNTSGGKLSMTAGHGWVYEHAIGTYALCEALTFVKELKMDFPNLEEACGKAVKLILDGQHPGGSWDYNYNKTSQRPGDTSILGWHVQALKAASHAGFDKQAIGKSVERALHRLEEVQNDNGTFGYTGKGNPADQRLAGVGALCYQIWGKENHKVTREAVCWMSRNMEPVYTSESANLYAWYYTTLSLFQRGSTPWEKWNRKWRDQLLNNQNENGTWKPEGSFGRGAMSTSAAGRDAEIYRLCLNTLGLEAYYRFLPATGGGE